VRDTTFNVFVKSVNRVKNTIHDLTSIIIRPRSWKMLVELEDSKVREANESKLTLEKQLKHPRPLFRTCSIAFRSEMRDPRLESETGSTSVGSEFCECCNLEFNEKEKKKCE
jgi:hypothetical protein